MRSMIGNYPSGKFVHLAAVMALCGGILSTAAFAADPDPRCPKFQIFDSSTGRCVNHLRATRQVQVPPGASARAVHESLRPEVAGHLNSAAYSRGDDPEGGPLVPKPVPPKFVNDVAPGSAVSVNAQAVPPRIEATGTVARGAAVGLNPQPLPPKVSCPAGSVFSARVNACTAPASGDW